MTRRMWWTQPKLALIVLGVNAVAVVLAAIASQRLGAAIGMLAGLQVALLGVYAKVARHLGERHLRNATRTAFDERLWNKPWRPSRDKWTQPGGTIPHGGDNSFYRQVLGDLPESREALYRALAAWEGARLVGIDGILTLGAALASGTVTMTLWRGLAGSNPPLLAAALAVPLCVLLLPEALVVLRLRRGFLRAGAVARVAVLVPRDAVDLGLRTTEEGENRDMFVAMSVALGAPVVIIVAVVGGVGALLLALLAAVAGTLVVVWAARAFLRLLVNGIPFLRFEGPAAVSVLLDLAHRQRAYLSATVLLALPLLVGVFMRSQRLAPPLLHPLPYAYLIYLAAITFGDQLSGYAGFMNATHFEACFKRSMARMDLVDAGTGVSSADATATADTS